MELRNIDIKNKTITFVHRTNNIIKNLYHGLKSRLIKRGKNSSTTYLLIPKQFRKGLKNKDKYRCYKIDDDFIFTKGD